MSNSEAKIEHALIEKLSDLKYAHRADIRDRDALERNFREKFEALNRVSLTDLEFRRLLEEIVSADVFSASKRLRERNTFFREDGTPLQYTLVNIKDWCKNEFEVVSHLRINTNKHKLETFALQAFTDGVMFRMIFDGERLNDLFAHLELGWKARVKRELALMGDLTPFLKKLAAGREISGLKAYEE